MKKLPTDYAIPWWRHNVHISLLAARLGDAPTAIKAQDDAAVDMGCFRWPGGVVRSGCCR
jgi:hypothetical protein